MDDLAQLRNSHVIGYVRVSSKEQTLGYSLEQQIQRIRSFCAANQLTLIFTFSDPGRTGRSIERRPGMQEALRLVGEGRVGGLIVTRADRLSRVVTDNHQIESWLIRYQTALVALEPFSVTCAPGNSADHINFHAIQQLMAQEEVDKLRQRILPGMLTAARRGGRGGHVPLGYVRLDDQHWAIDERLGPVITELFRHVANDHWSAYKCYGLVKSKAMLRADDKAIGFEQISYLLRNPWYLGRMTWNPPKTQGQDQSQPIVHDRHHPPLVDAELFARVQAELDRQANLRATKRAERISAQSSPGDLPPAASAAAAKTSAKGVVTPVTKSTIPLRSPSPPSLAQRLRTRPQLEEVLAKTAAAQNRGHGIVPPSVAFCRCGGKVYCTLHTLGPPKHRYKVAKYTCERHRRDGNAACTETSTRADVVDSLIEHRLLSAAHHGQLAQSSPGLLPANVTEIDRSISELSDKCQRLRSAVATTAEADRPRLTSRLQSLDQETSVLQQQRERLLAAGGRPIGQLGAFIADPKSAWDAFSHGDRRRLVAQTMRSVIIAGKTVQDITWSVPESPHHQRVGAKDQIHTATIPTTGGRDHG